MAPDILIKALQLYVKYGLSVNGFIIGANALHPKTNSMPHFFGPTPELTSLLQDLLWNSAHMRQYLITFA